MQPRRHCLKAQRKQKLCDTVHQPLNLVRLARVQSMCDVTLGRSLPGAIRWSLWVTCQHDSVVCSGHRRSSRSALAPDEDSRFIQQSRILLAESGAARVFEIIFRKETTRSLSHSKKLALHRWSHGSRQSSCCGTFLSFWASCSSSSSAHSRVALLNLSFCVAGPVHFCSQVVSRMCCSSFFRRCFPLRVLSPFLSCAFSCILGYGCTAVHRHFLLQRGSAIGLVMRVRVFFFFFLDLVPLGFFGILVVLVDRLPTLSELFG